MPDQWERLSIVSPGGTVFQIVSDDSGRAWLATEAGIFRQESEGWQPLPQGQPLGQLTALASAGQTLFAGGGQGQIFYSTNGGLSWFQGRAAQPDGQPVSYLVASPNFERDRTMLAGIDGGGVLRSTDGGRNWQWSNFGLQDFTVLTIATAPRWERREFVYLATTESFYRSPTGGRAWQRAETGLEGVAVQSIGVSSNFAQDRLVLVGTETQGIFRSTDQGKSWQPSRQGISAQEDGAFPSINFLWLHPDFATTPVVLAGTSDGQIFRSHDGGTTWQPVASTPASLLACGGSPDRLYAGLHDLGLLASVDGGETWQEVPQLAARLVTRLVSGPETQLFAYGLWEGVWHSADGGASWMRENEASLKGPLLALLPPAAEQALMLLGTAEGLLRSTDVGRSWQPVLDTRWGSVATITSQANQVWVGTSTGDILTSNDAGLNWTELSPPRLGDAVTALALFPAAVVLAAGRKGATMLLAAATYDVENRKITVWYSANEGQKWTQWLQATVNWPSVQMSLLGRASNQAIAAIDRRVWRTTAAGWEPTFEADRPIVRLSRRADGTIWALTAQQVLHSRDGVNWTSFSEGLPGVNLLDLSQVGATVYVLSSGGVVWRRIWGNEEV